MQLLCGYSQAFGHIKQNYMCLIDWFVQPSHLLENKALEQNQLVYWFSWNLINKLILSVVILDLSEEMIVFL